jgi:hypothetical protein
VSVVIMLAKIMEAGKEKVYQYWPDEKQVPATYGTFSVTLRDIEIQKENTSRRFEIKDSQGTTRQVSQIQCNNFFLLILCFVIFCRKFRYELARSWSSTSYKNFFAIGSNG